jgi:hypothetical protein
MAGRPACSLHCRIEPSWIKATALRAAAPGRARVGRAPWRPVPPQRAGPAVRERSVLDGQPNRSYAGTVFSIRVKQPQSIAGRCWNAAQSVLSFGAVALIVLKLTGIIGWLWWWVLAPVWIGGVQFVAVLCGLGGAALLGMGRRTEVATSVKESVNLSGAPLRRN